MTVRSDDRPEVKVTPTTPHDTHVWTEPVHSAYHKGMVRYCMVDGCQAVRRFQADQ